MYRLSSLFVDFLHHVDLDIGADGHLSRLHAGSVSEEKKVNEWLELGAHHSKEDNKLKSKLKAQECSERMSPNVSSHTSFNSRRSAGNSRSDEGSNYRSDRANSHNKFHGIKFVFGRPDQVPIYLQSM